MKFSLKIATRESQLALWQAQYVRSALLQAHPHLHIELLPMRTTGDRFLEDRLQRIGGKGHFVKELEEALLTGRADLAVHSMKDVPSHFPDGLILSAICERANPLDAFVSTQYNTLLELPPQAIVGTASLRRQAQILALRPDLRVNTLRGNLQTRLDKLRQGQFDAIILAAAGLERLQLQQHIKSVFNSDDMLPACGQGALGIECRADDLRVQALVASLHHAPTALCVHSERQVNACMGGSCHAPIAVFAELLGEDKLRLKARIFSSDGQSILATEQSGSADKAAEIAQHCADSLQAQGGMELIAQALQTL
ncbi:MAG: hydroxymethylbilane synthase [Legionellaceae bacterium]|nr:hydroxymethylbilane synthase [Legionellaceae bacterium]